MTLQLRARSVSEGKISPPRLRFGLFLLFTTSACFAAEPDLQTINVRGLQVGGTTTLTIDGDRFGTTPKLLLPFAAKQTVKPGGTDKKATIDVTLDDAVSPGYYNLRLATEGGVSLPVLIGVDKLSQRPLTPSLESSQIAVTGSVAGSSIAETSFAGKAGQKIIIEVESQRLGGKLRPVLHLYGPQRRQVAWSWPASGLFGDTRIEATLPSDGTYTVAVHDHEYAGPAPGHFRLKLGQWNSADQFFPPVIGKDTKTVELIGPGPQVRVDVPPVSGFYAMLPWPKESSWSGPRPFVQSSNRTEVLELPASAKPQELPALPLGVSGRLAAPNEEDRYRLPVTPNSRVKFEVFAERLGSPIDVAFVIRNELGADLVRAEDSPGTLDPVIEYTVPDKVTAIQVAIVDSQGRGSPRGIYRLTAEIIQLDSPGDFRLFTPSQRISLPVGGRCLVPVFVERRGSKGPIVLSAEGLPPGSKLENTIIPPGSDGTLINVSLSTGGNATISNWKGRGDTGIERPVVQRGHALEKLQPWLASELAIAATNEKLESFSIDWRNFAADAGLPPAGKLSLPVSVKRPDPATPVRLTLLSSQAAPILNNQPNPNAAIRVESAIELGAKVGDGDMPLLVPADLPADSYQLAVQAEILTADKRTVLATVYTPVRSFAVKLPVLIKVESPPHLEATLDPKAGATIEVVGRVERQYGFFGDVELTLTGLPAGVRADAVTVKTFQSKFVMKIVLPPNAAAGEIKGLKLNASAAPDAKLPAVRVRSRDVELTLNVLAGKK